MYSGHMFNDYLLDFLKPSTMYFGLVFNFVLPVFLPRKFNLFVLYTGLVVNDLNTIVFIVLFRRVNIIKCPVRNQLKISQQLSHVLCSTCFYYLSLTLISVHTHFPVFIKFYYKVNTVLICSSSLFQTLLSELYIGYVLCTHF